MPANPNLLGISSELHQGGVLIKGRGLSDANQ